MTLAINHTLNCDNSTVTRFPRSSVVMEITPEIAAEMLTHNIGNRRLRTTAVLQYASDMAAGRWHADADGPIVFDWNGRLINGQHRLYACIEAGVSFTARVNRGADPSSYDVIDQGARRSAADALTNHSIANAKLVASAYRLINEYRMAQIKVNWGGAGLTNSEVLRGVLAQSDLLQRASNIASIVYKARKYTLAAVAALYVLVIDEGYSSQLADEFMDGLASGANMGGGDPRLAFMRWWANSNNRRGSATLAALIRSFNAYAKNQELRQIKINTAGGFPRLEPATPLI